MSSNVFQAPGDSVPPLGEGHAALADALDQGYCVAEVLLDGEGTPQDYRFVYVNRLFSGFTGISREDALSGKTAREIVPGLEDHWVQTYGNVALTGEPIQFEAGSEAMGRWFEVKAFRFGDAESRRIGILFADLTEQARARRAASQSEARYQALATASSDVAYGMSADWSVMLPLDGRGLVASNEEPIQNWLEKNIPSSEHAAIREGIARAVASKSLFDMEHRVTRPDGSAGWTRSRAVPILDDMGNIVEWFGAASDITDRKRAEEELREGEERQAFLLALSDALRPLTEPADIAALAAERLGERFGMNRVFYAEIDGARMTVERDYARDVEPIVGKHDLSAFGPELLAEYRDGKIVTVDDVATDSRFGDEARAGLLSRKVAAYVDVVLFRQEQSVGLLAVQSATPRKWTPSEQGLFQEVGERVRYAIERARAEASLRESEDRFRGMADHAPMMVWVTEPDGSCSYLSQSWYEFTGQTPKTGLGYGWVQATHPDDMEKAEREFVEANRDRRPFQIEYRLRRVDGQYRWAIDSAKPRFGAAGEYLGYVGSVIDITDRKEAEEVLRRSEERFRVMTDAVPQIVWIVGADGGAEYFNRQWYEYTGASAPLLTAREVAEAYVHPDDVEKTMAHFEESARSGEGFLVEHRIRSGAGEYRWFLVRAKPYLDPETGVMARWYGSSTDIHDSKLKDEALRQANEMLERRVEERTGELVAKNQELEGFMYSVSHDLRSPLRAIVSNAQITLEEEGPNVSAEGKHNLQRLSGAAKRMAELVDDLLQYARLGTRELRLETVDLGDLAREVAAGVAEERPDSEFSVRAECDTLVECDPRLIGMALHNLLDNACKYHRPGEPARAEFACEERDGERVFSVRDAGIGFDMAYVGKLFKPFERLHREEFAGTGIGLANVKRAIERHGGRVWAESDGPGTGARFYFTLS